MDGWVSSNSSMKFILCSPLENQQHIRRSEAHVRVSCDTSTHTQLPVLAEQMQPLAFSVFWVFFIFKCWTLSVFLLKDFFDLCISAQGFRCEYPVHQKFILKVNTPPHKKKKKHNLTQLHTDWSNTHIHFCPICLWILISGTPVGQKKKGGRTAWMQLISEMLMWGNKDEVSEAAEWNWFQISSHLQQKHGHERIDHSRSETLSALDENCCSRSRRCPSPLPPVLLWQDCDYRGSDSSALPAADLRAQQLVSITSVEITLAEGVSLGATNSFFPGPSGYSQTLTASKKKVCFFFSPPLLIQREPSFWFLACGAKVFPPEFRSPSLFKARPWSFPQIVWNPMAQEWDGVCVNI